VGDDFIFPPDGAEVGDLVAAYLRHTDAVLARREPEEHAAQVDFWIGNLVLMGRPEEAWPILIAAIDATDDERTLDLLGAGHLEDLVREHGERFIDRIEGRARTNGRFRRALAGVWAADAPVRPRIDALLDEPDPPRPGR